MLECLALLGKRLGALVPVATSAGAQQQQQQQEPAYAALSQWAHEALQQEEPECKSVPLVRGLLDLFIRYHGEGCGNVGRCGVGMCTVLALRLSDSTVCRTQLLAMLQRSCLLAIAV